MQATVMSGWSGRSPAYQPSPVAASRAPRPESSWVRRALVDHGAGLVDAAGGQGDDAQGGPPLAAGGRQEAALGRDPRVEVVEDGGAVDDHLAVVEDERRDAAERIDRPHRLGVGEAAEGVALEGQPEEVQGDGDATDVGAVVLSDEDHQRRQRSTTAAIEPTVAPP
jgi:hypothetical protein